MRHMFIACALLVACAGSPSDDDTDNAPVDRAKRCSELQQHVIDLRLADTAGPSSGAAQFDTEAHRKAMKSAMGSGFVSDCVAAFSDEEMRCVMDAKGSLEASECAHATTVTQ